MEFCEAKLPKQADKHGNPKKQTHIFLHRAPKKKNTPGPGPDEANGILKRHWKPPLDWGRMRRF
jgi:hypothetical protein